MRKQLYDIVEKEAILTITEEEQEPIIEGLLYKEDYILLVAEPKRGKTIIGQQMACSLTQGKPFLDTFDIPKAVRCWYFATEGKKNDLKDRFIRMNNGVGLDTDKLVLIPTRFRFNTTEGAQALKEIMTRYADRKPQVIFVDALYRAVKGSITKDDVINEFHHLMGLLSSDCEGASIVLVHHMTKPQRDKEGNYYERKDTDSFGSTFLGAGVDHVFWLDKCKKNKGDLILRCDTQRSGKVIEDLRLRLKEPDPLYFELVSLHAEERHKFIEVLRNIDEGLTYNAIMVRAKIGKTTFYSVKRELEEEGVIEVIKGGKNRIRLKGEK